MSENQTIEQILSEVAEEIAQEEEVTEEEVVEEEVEEVEEVEGTEEESPENEDGSKNAKAFQALRQRAEKAEAINTTIANQLAFFENLAKSNNITLEQLMESVEQSRLESEAREREVPIDVLKERESYKKQIQATNAQLSAYQEQIERATFDSAFNEFNEEFNLDEEQVTDFFAKAISEGIDLSKQVSSKSLRNAYLILNEDKALEIARQKILSEGKKQTKKAPVTLSGGSGTSLDSADDVDEQAKKSFKGTILEQLFK